MFNGTTRPIEITDRATSAFWSCVSKPNGEGGCWIWTGKLDGDGYGLLFGIRAHRYAYTLLVGPIPPGLVIDHLCRVHSCVHPFHLEAVTNGENVLRGIAPPAQNKRRRLCRSGHDLTSPESYYTRPSRPTERRCKACQQARDTQRPGRWRAA